jgi:para-aminobenzoate synthetase/4-amino-4-deoxychorismate lyase
LRTRASTPAIHFEAYERAFAAAAAQGLDEVLFLNRRGEVAEASRNSVFVELDGRLVTPPLSSGLLPGVLRWTLLESGQAIEGMLSFDVLRSNPIRLGNSLHGLRSARLQPVRRLESSPV